MKNFTKTTLLLLLGINLVQTHTTHTMAMSFDENPYGPVADLLQSGAEKVIAGFNLLRAHAPQAYAQTAQTTTTLANQAARGANNAYRTAANTQLAVAARPAARNVFNTLQRHPKQTMGGIAALASALIFAPDVVSTVASDATGIITAPLQGAYGATRSVLTNTLWTAGATAAGVFAYKKIREPITNYVTAHARQEIAEIKAAGETIKTDIAKEIAGPRLTRQHKQAHPNTQLTIGDAVRLQAQDRIRKIDEKIEQTLTEIKDSPNTIINFMLKNAFKSAAVAAASAALYIGATRGSQLMMDLIQIYFNRPTLIIDSSAQNFATKTVEGIMNELFPPVPISMIFNEKLKKELDTIIKATKNIHAKIIAGKKNVKYRNLMLWGPPGTGKTMFAKKIARESGLAWAQMSGASFSKFTQGQSIQELDKLMKWAKNCKGLLIFVDEAEAFLRKRENMDPNSEAYQLLNNFLNYTGERSDRFMFVFATNHKDIIDSAMHRRIDDLLHVPLAEREERVQVLEMYRNKILFDVAQNGIEFVQQAQIVLPDRKLFQISDRTKGLSNGDLEGIMNTIKTDADTTESGLITEEIVDGVVERAMRKHSDFNAPAA